MLRLCSQTNTQNIPCVHHPFNPVPTYSLHSLGEKLSVAVSFPFRLANRCQGNLAATPVYLLICLFIDMLLPVTIPLYKFTNPKGPSLLCSQLFGEDEDSEELDEAEKQGENC